MPDDQVRRLVDAAGGAVYPSSARMLDYLANEYLQGAARQQPGVWAVTDGEEIYATLARQHTTIDLTPGELHEIGLQDLGRIHGEMRAIMAKLGDDSGNIRAFTERLTRDARNLPERREEIVQAAEEYLRQAYEALPRSFGHLPQVKCVVRQIEEYRERDHVAAFYLPPSEDGGRRGTFYVNTYDPPSRPRHTLPALVFHEGVPGHPCRLRWRRRSATCPLSAGSALAGSPMPSSKGGPCTPSGWRTSWGCIRTTWRDLACWATRRGRPAAWWSTRGCTTCGGSASRRSISSWRTWGSPSLRR